MPRRISALGILIVVLLTVFFPILFQGKVLLPLDFLNTMNLPFSTKYPKVSVHNHFECDAIDTYYPYRVFTRQELSQGHFSYWNQYIMGGFPQYAQTIATNFNITNFLLPCFSMPLAFHLQVIIQLLIAGFGMYLLLKYYRVIESIALLFATAYMLNSMFITTASRHWIIGSFCWMPYIIITLGKYYETKKLPFLILSGFFLAFAFLGGSFQTSMFICFILFVFSITYCLFVAQQKGLSKILFAPLVVFSIGFALCAIMWVPSLEMLWLDILDDGVSRVAGAHMHYSFWQRIITLPLLASFFIPELVGSVRAFDLTKIARLSIDSFNGFAGFIPNLFGIWGAFFLWKRQPRSRPFIVLIFAGLLIPLVTPLYKYVYYRFLIIFISGITVVGALSLDMFVRAKEGWVSFGKWYRYTLILFLAIIIAVSLVNIAISMKHDYFYSLAKNYIEKNMHRATFAGGNIGWLMSRIDKTFEHFSFLSRTMYIPFLCLTGIFILLYYFLKGRLKSVIILAAFSAITFTQLLIFSRSWLPMIDPVQYPLYPKTQATDFLHKDPDIFRVLIYNDLAHAQRIFSYNLLSMYKIANLSNAGQSICPRTINSILQGKKKPSLRLLGLANVKYILTTKYRKLVDPALVLVNEGAIKIYRNLNWRPRAFIAYRYEVEPDDSSALRKVRGEDFDGSAVVFKYPPGRSINFSGSKIKNNIKFLISDNNILKIRADTDKDGYLVLADTYYPGWKVFVNNKEGKIMQANYVMRAVFIPAGKNIVVFRFEPFSFKLGSGLSIFTIFVCAAYLCAYFMQRKKLFT